MNPPSGPVFVGEPVYLGLHHNFHVWFDSGEAPHNQRFLVIHVRDWYDYSWLFGYDPSQPRVLDLDMIKQGPGTDEDKHGIVRYTHSIYQLL